MDSTEKSSSFFSRKSPRIEFHDYSGGDYFITICTRDKEHYFGKIINGEMEFTELGRYCQQQIASLSVHYPYAEPILYVVMPNHVHAIIRISTDSLSDICTARGDRTHEPCVPTVRTALSVVIGGFKRAVTMFARRNNIDFGWQERYHDHNIRGKDDGNKIADYIETNVIRWDMDCFNKTKSTAE